MDIGEAVNIVSKSAIGLDYAHEKGLIHHDIKPANIIINAQGNPIIMGCFLPRKRRYAQRGRNCRQQGFSYTALGIRWQHNLHLRRPCLPVAAQEGSAPEDISLALDQLSAGGGVHEFKVMTADGSSYFLILPDVDILDDGIGCGA